MTNEPNIIRAYIDGGTVGNGTKDAIAGCGVYFPDDPDRNLSSPVPGLKQTNQVAELYAAVLALECTEDLKQLPIHLYSDSQYCIKIAQKLWRAKDNLDLVHRLWKLMENRTVVWHKVKGHSGDPGNDAADALATEAIEEIRNVTIEWAQEDAGKRQR